MKKFTKNISVLLALVFTMSFNVNSQEIITQENIGSAVDLWLSNQVLAETTYGHISDWDVSGVTDMKQLFKGLDFNQNIGGWDVSSVTDMTQMFMNCNFNQDIGSWNVSSVTTMRQIFKGSENFNQDIGGWDVSSVTDMREMFSNTAFNQNIGGWDVSSVTNMRQMFNGCDFNQDIGGWDVSSATSMYGMFANGIFNQDIGNWDVSNVSNMTGMFNNNISFSSENYDSLLIGWSTLNLQMNVTLSTISVGYNTSCVERELIISNYGWTISDGGLVAVDGDCAPLPLLGCMDIEANNYNSDADLDDGSCTYNGCTDESAFNFNEIANVDDGSCVAVVEGCMNATAFNYNTDANVDDGSCVAVVEGCIDATAFNYNADANVDDGSCNSINLNAGWSMFGYTCLESLNVVEAFSDISDNIEIVKDEWGLAYLPAWGFSAFDNLEFAKGYQIKMTEEVIGFQFCTLISQADVDAAYDAGASSVTPEDGIGQADVDAAYNVGYSDGASSVTPEDGITQADVDAAYSAGAASVTPEDGISGCMDESACNYVSEASEDNGSCTYPNLGYDCEGNITEYVVGMEAEGGIVFYVDGTGQHGLVSAMEDVGKFKWGCFGTEISGADGQSIGTGYQNTLDIVSGCSQTQTGAYQALAYESGGYSDWYLPSIDELVEMYYTIGDGSCLGNIGGFAGGGGVCKCYLSSSEDSSSGAYYVNFSIRSGVVSAFNKGTPIKIRAIRAF